MPKQVAASTDRGRLKTQSLSLRLDPKTKFILDFVARLRGQSITTVVERAIKESAAGISLGPKWDNHGNEIDQRNWTRYWDPSEGVRALNLLADSEYPTTFDEDELREFTTAHWPFFYNRPDGAVPKRAYVEILWSRIDEYLELWRKTKREDYWAVGRAMAEAIGAAKVVPPQWPPQTSIKSPPKPTDLDDEIPF